MTPAVVAVALLTAVYALALASADPWDVTTGAAVSTALVALLRSFLLPRAGLGPLELARRALWAVPLSLVALRDVVAGTWQVTLVVLGLRPLVSPGIVAVPIGERSRLGVAVSTLLVTLAPGEFLVDVDWGRRVMLVHVLDARDPDAVRAHHARLYRLQRRVVP